MFFVGENKKKWLFLAGLITVFNIVSASYYIHPTIPRAVIENGSPVIDFLRTRPGKIFSLLDGDAVFRIFGPSVSPTTIARSMMYQPIGNLPMFYGLYTADYYDNLMSRRMSRLLSFIGASRATIGNSLANVEMSSEDKVKLFSQRTHIVNLLGIRYVISAFSIDVDALVPIFASVMPGTDLNVTVYENKNATPWAYFAQEVKKIPIDEAIAYQMVVDAPDNVTILECNDNCPYVPVELTADRGVIELQRLDNNRIMGKVISADARVLIITENHLPGWRFFMDGVEQPIFTVNSVFIGAIVTPGVHSVELIYNPLWAI